MAKKLGDNPTAETANSGTNDATAAAQNEEPKPEDVAQVQTQTGDLDNAQRGTTDAGDVPNVQSGSTDEDQGRAVPRVLAEPEGPRTYTGDDAGHSGSPKLASD